MKWTESAWPALAVLFLTLQVGAQSVTKCGNTGDTSYYNSTTLPYVFYNNPWGNDGSGFSCITVKNNGTAFDATWRWINNSDSVHAYPHFKLDSPLYPLSVRELAAVDFEGTWGLNVTSAANDTDQQRLQALDDNYVQYNVALDMFLDANASQASADLPGYEIMVWLSYSYDVYPVGIDKSSPDKDQYIIGDTRFFLFSGTNSQNQTVFSWLPEHNLTASNADYSPLIHYLWQFNFMPADIYLGTVQFGTETYHATSEVLFRATNYTLSLDRNRTQDLSQSPLQRVDTVSVPTQVPTMDRFKSLSAPRLCGGNSISWLAGVWSVAFIWLTVVW
ncbi:hypothetical protein A1O1_02320 [Capronia coronata CBS 617.96]|uniref:Murein transglycosylase n=1 Tax=Capronia coronata CBS 617.96 TaxID=1182541 RepID=W9YM14_9EURO|nr:uncharacterized protein A1O1_02320 [Capronia coronata CBS 617.96]EXJ93927.1 hypothetical protein A1O1_02320 [Capronia coronata CBS 617.96]